MYKKILLLVVLLIVIFCSLHVIAGAENVSNVNVKLENDVTGEIYLDTTNAIKEGGSWGIMPKKFENAVANHKTFKKDGYKYTFDKVVNSKGEEITGTQRFYCTGEDYTVVYYALYNKELLGSLKFTINDEHGHNGHYMEYTDEADYKFTFKEPVDVEDGYKFLYYQDRVTGEVYNPHDVFVVGYNEFKGIEKIIDMDAIYERIIDDDNHTNNESNEQVNESNSTNSSNNNSTLPLNNSVIKNDGKNNRTAISNGENISISHETGNNIRSLVVVVLLIIATTWLFKRK